jgi:uncharacterized phage protein gp47/JayE
MVYGVTTNGFVKKTFNVILTEKTNNAKVIFGSDVDLTDTSPLYKFLQTTTFEEVALWDMAETIYYNGFLETAIGQSLDKLVRLLGVYRLSASKSIGEVTFTGNNGVVINAGVGVQTASGIQFITTESGTISGTTVILDIESVLYGETNNVAATTINVLSQSIAGVSSVNNALLTSGGENVESDADLRLRAMGALELTGNATVEAIRQAVLAVSGVTYASVIENLTTHSVNVVVLGVAYDASPTNPVYIAIDETRAAGIAFTWQNPAGVTVNIVTVVDVNSLTVPSDAVTQITTAIQGYINGLNIGADVIRTKIMDVIFNLGDWVIDITTLTLNAGTVNIVVTATQKAASGTMGVTTNPITPP